MNRLIQVIRKNDLSWNRFKYKAKTKFYEKKFSDFDSFFEYESGRGFPYTKLKAKLSIGYDIDIYNPKTFNEKLICRRLFSRFPLWVTVTDKVSVRDWIVENGYTKYVNLIPATKFHQVDELMEIDVNKPLVIKAAWASGLNLFISTREELEKSLPLLEQWFYEPYKVTSLIWASSQIPRTFLVEEKLTSENGTVPVDYKFFVINGRVEFIQLDIGRFARHQRALFDAKGVRLPYYFTSYENAGEDEALPDYVAREMIDVAQKLGEKFSFVRVDLYYHNGKVYFGELTQTPSAGFGRFSDKCFDVYLGDKWINYDRD